MSASGSPAPSSQNSRLPDPAKVEIPRDQSLTQKVSSPMATLSSVADPYPHYIMSGACAGAGLYSYNTMRNPRVAALAGGFSAAYLLAGRMLANGNHQLGYDLGTITSVGLLATAVPAARATGDSYSVAMTALGGVSFLANLLKSYQQRTGKPFEMHENEHPGRHH